MVRTLTSPTVLPALKPKGSKNPSGAVCPARPSADMDTLANDGRAIKVGRNATAEAASDAMMIVWNIVGSLLVVWNELCSDRGTEMRSRKIP